MWVEQAIQAASGHGAAADTIPLEATPESSVLFQSVCQSRSSLLFLGNDHNPDDENDGNGVPPRPVRLSGGGLMVLGTDSQPPRDAHDPRPVRRRRFLIVVPYPVLPAQGGGQIRMVGLARGIARCGQSVTILTPYHSAQRAEVLENELFELRQVPCLLPLNSLLRGRLLPYHAAASFHPGLGWLVSPTMRAFDVVIFAQVSFASLLSCIPEGVQVAYDAQNVEFDYVRQECQYPWVADLVGRRIRGLEQALVDRSDHVFSVSSEDRCRLQELYVMPGGKCTLARNGIANITPPTDDASAMEARFPPIAAFHRIALYSGSDVEHNRLAVRFLLEHVAPRATEIGFVIHGGCGQRFSRQTTLPNVFYDTDHRHFSQYAVTRTIGLNLVNTGSGTNLKLLHYLSHGLPVLSTPFGVRGYQDLESLVLIRDREQFAEALREGHFPKPPDREYLWKNYSWDRIARDMVQTLEGTAAR